MRTRAHFPNGHWPTGHGLAALGYFGTAWIHSTGFDSVTALATEGPEEMAGLGPALWLAFSLDLIVLGLIILGAALRRGGAARAVIAVAALCPLGAARFSTGSSGSSRRRRS